MQTFLNDICKELYIASTEQKALKIYKQYKPDIIITEVKLINSNGINFIQLIRQSNQDIPIIVTTSSKESKYLLPAIPLMLTDYLIKPITNNTILASLNKAIEKFILLNKSTYIFNNGICFDINQKIIIKDGEEIILSLNEYKLLKHLLTNSNSPISAEELELTIWDTKIVTNLALRSLITRLRKKIGKETITNLPGLGYSIKIN